MKAVIQRVSNASVEVDNKLISSIQRGWLVFLGIGKGDSEKNLKMLADKILNLRGFNDSEGRMNLNALQLKIEILIVSQFTLYADCSSGKRPSFINAESSELSSKLYDKFCDYMELSNIPIKRGVFQANMQVNLTNDGPFTFILEY